jgi:hypothetical protein
MLVRYALRSSFAAKILPTGSCEEMELAMLTLSVVPAGIVAAAKDEPARQVNIIVTNGMNLLRIIGDG